MATNYIKFDDTSHGGRLLRNGLNQLESGLNTLKGVLGMLDQAKDDGNVSGTISTLLGTPDITTAQAAYSELSADLAKLTTDASVTNVQTALTQLFNKFR